MRTYQVCASNPNPFRPVYYILCNTLFILKIIAVLRRGALLNLDKQKGVEQNPIHSYTNRASVNDLVMLLCCTKLTYQIYLSISHGVTFNLIPNCTESSYGQISIESATYSLLLSGHVGWMGNGDEWGWMGIKECRSYSTHKCPWFFPWMSGVIESPHPYLILVWVWFLNCVQWCIINDPFPDLDFILKCMEISIL